MAQIFMEISASEGYVCAAQKLLVRISHEILLGVRSPNRRLPKGHCRLALHRCSRARSHRAPQRTAQFEEGVPIWPGQSVGDLEPWRLQFGEDMSVRADSRVVIEQASVYLEPVPSRIHIGRGYVRTAAAAEADAVRRRRFQDRGF